MWEQEPGGLETRPTGTLSRHCGACVLEREILSERGWTVEPAKNKTAARKYCMKEDSRIDGPYEFGTWGTDTTQGRRTDWEAIRDMINLGSTFAEIRERFPGECCRSATSIKEWIYEVEGAKILQQMNEDCTDGFVPGEGGRGWQVDLVNTIETNYDEGEPRTVNWICDDTGNKGKTALSKFIRAKMPNVQIILPGKLSLIHI